MKLRFILPALIFFGLTLPAIAKTNIHFSISGMDPVSVMRFVDEKTKTTQIGYIQSTDLSHTEISEQGAMRTITDGIVYYTVMFEARGHGGYQMSISYDFAASDGTSRGIRMESQVNQEVLKSISSIDIAAKAAVHGEAFAQVIFEYYLKETLAAEAQESLKVFLTEISQDLLKSMPKDGLNIMRRWEDLTKT